MDVTKAVEGAQMSAEVSGDSLTMLFTVFVLAVFVGYYVVWNVTSALHSPLMSVTNAISSVIIVGALIAAGPMEVHFSKVMGFIAVVLASINIFGGFVVSQRMLQMFRKKG
jgi:NAD(P) transhydrogenase subunit alpha